MSSLQPGAGSVSCCSSVPSVATEKMAPWVLSSSRKRRNAMRPGGTSAVALDALAALGAESSFEPPQLASAPTTASTASAAAARAWRPLSLIDFPFRSWLWLAGDAYALRDAIAERVVAAAVGHAGDGDDAVAPVAEREVGGHGRGGRPDLDGVE